MTGIPAADTVARPTWATVYTSPDFLGRTASWALRSEALLTPKPGLVDCRGGGAHDDMTLEMLLRSANALALPIAQCAQAASMMPLGVDLRACIGAIGRDGESRMLDATDGVNTHRGALWALGLLAAGAAVAPWGDVNAAATYAARLASLPDRALSEANSRVSNGSLVQHWYGAPGARGEAQRGFPHLLRVVLPSLRLSRTAGSDERTARTDALLACMAGLEDTCLLYRAGVDGLRAVQHAAGAVARAGGSGTARGRARLQHLDGVCRSRRLSPGGSGDLLAAALFLDFATTLGWRR